jgi:hypothetical protein
LKKMLIAVLLCLLCFAQLAVAQSLLSGDVAGTVTDATGAIVPGATVALKGEATGQARAATTNTSGNFRFSLLQPGTYTIEVKAPGFGTQSKKVVVAVGQAASADFALQVSGSTQIVEVTGETPMLNVENGNSATTFNNQMIENMPNGGGDLTQFAQLAAGSVMSLGGGYGNFTSNGMPANTNVFTVNGTNNMDPYFNINNSGATNLTLGANEIAEAAVVSNAYSGEYGQQVGAQVNYVTKGGTNAFHGDAKYNWTGRALTARDYFNTRDNAQPFTNNNQWAVSAGGPIQKDKTFFFANYEGLRYILATSTEVYTPTQQFANATLNHIAAVSPSQVSYYQKYFGLFAQAQGASGAVPDASLGCGDLDPTTIGMAATAPCVGSYRAGAGQLSTEWVLSARVDHNFGNNDRAYVRYRMDRGVQATYTDPISPDFNATSTQPAYDGQLQWTHIFGNGATNQFQSSLDWYSAPFVSNPKGYETFPLTIQSFDIPLTDIGGTQFNFPQGRNVTQYQFIDDFAMPKGNHTFKFGVNYRRYDITDTGFSTYTKAARAIIYSTTDFVDGSIDYFRQRFPSRESQPMATYGLGVYGEDEWKVKPSFKLTLALRVEHNSNPVCQTDCFSQLNNPWAYTPHDVNTPYNKIITTGLHQAYRNTTPLVFAPRLGFAWTPFGLKNTVIRGGFGLFYDATAATLISSFARNYPGFVDITNQAGLNGIFTPWAPGVPGSAWTSNQVSAAALKSGYAAGLTMAQIRAQVIAAGATFTAPGYTVTPDEFKTPRYQKWNLELQQGFGKNTTLSMNYSGSHGLFISNNNASANAYKAAGIAPFPKTIPDGRFAAVSAYDSSGYSHYNGLTFSLQERVSSLVQLQANYTWAHSQDTISAAGGGGIFFGGDSYTTQINPQGLQYNNYSNSDYDVRHNLTLSYVVTPKFAEWFHAPKWIGSNWEFTGSMISHTGTPFTVSYNSVSLTRGTPAYFLPIYTGSAYPKACTSSAVSTPCLNADDFTPVTAASGISPMRRNTFYGPKFFNMDMGLQKGFLVPGSENMKFVFGVTAYNVFNHPNFLTPAAEVGGSLGTFGIINSTASVPTSPYGAFVGSAASARIVQMNLRFTF